MSFLLNALVLIYLLMIAPKILFDRILRGKKHPGFLQRAGFFLPKADRPVIWIHAVSVGEVKAVRTLFEELRQRRPDAFFLVTTTSATGQAEAQRSLSQADAFAYLPFDLTFVVKRWIQHFNPRHFILVESDFWFHLLAGLKKNETKISLVSGKLSERSARRFLRFPRFSRRLFAHFDHLCVQNQQHEDRFRLLLSDPSKLYRTGNLKLDLNPEPIRYDLKWPQPAIAITCTHAPEEELLLEALKENGWFLILAPRHPERFEEVAHLLKRKKLPFQRWSDLQIDSQGCTQPIWEKGSMLLIDAMGQLPICYAHSRLAILGGSYVDRIGGHNVLEPCCYGTPVFFGPYMHGQGELAQRAIESGAGLEVPLPQLKDAVSRFLTDERMELQMRASTAQIVRSAREATLKTINQLLGA